MKQRAERLTGYEVRRIGGGCGKVRFGAYDSSGRLVVEATHLIDDLALDLLVRKVLQIHSVQALEQSHSRCARCHGALRLQIHYRRYRSHGGTHRVENLEPVCAGCHRVIHRLERSKWERVAHHTNRRVNIGDGREMTPECKLSGRGMDGHY